MGIPKSLFLEVCKDPQGRTWGKARLCLKDGSCLVIESRVYRENDGADNGEYYAAGDDDENPDSVENKALDEALDKLFRLTKNKAVMRAIPLPARVALKLVVAARNMAKIKKAAEEKGDDEEYEEAAGALKRMARHRNPVVRRAVGALRVWN